MQWMEKWNAMVSEHSSDVKIPDLWRISALAEEAPTDAKEHMLIRLEGIGERNENLKAKAVSYTTNTAQQTRSTGRDSRWRLTTWAESELNEVE